MVLHIISYKFITYVRIHTKFFPACLRHPNVQCLKCFLVIACQKKKKFQQLKIQECLLSFSTNFFVCFGMVGKQWFTNVRMTVIFLIYNHFRFQLISIDIHIRAILDFQNNLYFQEIRQTNATISCHLLKNEFFIKRAIFPVKSKLQKLFWPLSYGINLEKVNSFIREQIRIIEFCYV